MGKPAVHDDPAGSIKGAKMAASRAGRALQHASAKASNNHRPPAGSSQAQKWALLPSPLAGGDDNGSSPCFGPQPMAGNQTFFSARRAPRRCSSSVVEHSLGKGEVESSILSCSTIAFNRLRLATERHSAATGANALARTLGLMAR